MRTLLYAAAVGSMGLCSPLGINRTEAQERKESTLSGAVEQQVAQSLTAAAGLPALLRDPAFDRYVDMNLLRKGWDNLDSSLLADVGLQLAEGERVLYRPHKAVGAEQILSLAIK